MSDLGPSVADIAQARNQKLQQEVDTKGQQMQLEVEADTAQEVAEELVAAHQAALHIKAVLPDPIQDTTQTQVCAVAALALCSSRLRQQAGGALRCACMAQGGRSMRWVAPKHLCHLRTHVRFV